MPNYRLGSIWLIDFEPQVGNEGTVTISIFGWDYSAILLEKMSNLSTVEEAQLLPEGKLREEELKKVSDIFSAQSVEVAALIIITIGDTSNINFKADVLERAYEYGWNKTEDIVEQIDKQTKKQLLKQLQEHFV